MNLEQYGVPGVIALVAIAAISGLVVWIKSEMKNARDERERMEQTHRSERDDWKRTIERQFEESNRATKDNTNVVSELNTLIKTLKK